MTMINKNRTPAWLSVCLVLVLAGCSSINNQRHSSVQAQSFLPATQGLQGHRVAFISPSMAVGNEEDRQTLALTFSSTLGIERPDIDYMPLSETLGAINRAGLADDYRDMFENYRLTGIFDIETLRKIGRATDARFLVQLKLASFSQESRGRYSLMGYRLFQTKHANIRLFFQIWDAQAGTIAWEGVEELTLAEDTTQERTITFTTVVEETARNLIRLLPRAEKALTREDGEAPGHLLADQKSGGCGLDTELCLGDKRR